MYTHKYKCIHTYIHTHTHTHTHTHIIINKDPLYSTRNSTPYSTITYIGKELIRITKSLCCIPETSTTWSINFTPINIKTFKENGNFKKPSI